ncbi:atrial natriuretic peptide-converting enzyme-like isoform X2 [Octopus sinensis]|uniref:Atrial natriuretic peptide-converting enzyme-like isoform X2 n=1 Tax=Octopus sinensis TaxID=2607531 RepID=A0A7E6EWM5_9MOLL|nr:atrial natriuretic peptide-converting enzyme-like isoform X2 [Octopus sinensis]
MKLSIFVHVILVLPLFLNKIEANMQLRHESENKAVFFEPLGHSHIGLVGNTSFYNAGLISIYRNNSWGYVCDDNWDMKDANVACKQLGFSRGAEVATGNSRYGLAESENFLMDNTDCKGDERALQYCSYDTEHDCKKDEAAGVICKPNTGCKPGWISGPSGCYRLFIGNARRLNAKEMCYTKDSHLVIIDSLEENAFLSVLLQTNNDNHVWLTDGFKNGRNWEWNYQRETISTFYWFPGWMPDKKSAEPSKRGRCISLSNVFEYDGELHMTSYFFWKTSNCSSVTGFICERKKTPDFTEDCYSGNGVSYRGSVSETGKGTPCLKWTENPKYNTINSPNAGLGDHNFCRNPDDDERPWCWVAPAFQNQFGYCKIDQCKNVTESTTVESTVTTYPTTVASTTPTTKPKPTCSPVQMLCKGSNTCISLAWRCDGERDCIRGDDEENCHCYSGNGVSYRGSVSETDGGTPCLKWTENPKYNTINSPNVGIGDHNFCRNPDDDKRPWCWVAPAFQNKFGYCKIDQCKNVTESTTVESTVTTFPTTVASTTRNISCNSDKMLCSVSSRKCIPISWKCDGEADCPDSEDEKNCELEVSCASNSMMCPSRKICIPLQWKCDGDRDCPEGEDESKCDIVTTTKATVTTTKATVATTQAPVTTTLSLDCPDNEMYCAATNTCILLSWKCDGENDCPNGEDEKDCDIVTTTRAPVTTTQAPVTTTLSLDCSDNEMYCTSTNTCILLSWKCDGENDCPNGEDEKDCDRVTTTQAPVTTTLSLDCRVNEMYCTATKSCILLSWKCDGQNDCPDGEDEKDCDYILDNFEKQDTSFVIHAFPKEFYVHIPLETCAKNCLYHREFVCKAFHYYEKDYQCKLFDTMKSLSLRPLSSGSYYVLSQKCTSTDFQCDNGRCIPGEEKCNGRDNCNDFSDEQDCGIPETLEIRLADGEEHSGRVEIKYLNEWGVVCDDKWDINDANVVCRMLGYKSAIKAIPFSNFGPGNANFLLTNVECIGNETSLLDCPKSPWRQHNCKRHETASVICKANKGCPPNQFECANSQCRSIKYICDRVDNCGDNSDEKYCTASVKLVNGTNPSNGRIQITINNITGTICDDNFNNKEATVICKQLGYKSGIALPGGTYGKGNGIIWYDEVNCYGNENSIEFCNGNTKGEHDCDHTEDVGVQCYRDAITTTTFPTTTTVASTTTVAPVCGKVSHQIKTKYANRAIDKPFYSKLVNEDTAYGMYPWQVAVEHITGAYSDFYYSTEYFCGGTILHNDWIISAAHCFVGKKKESLIIKVGDHNKKIWDTYEQTFKVAELIIHAKYDDNSYDYDIALIKIEPNKKGNGIVFNDYVQPACLPDKNTTYFESERCHISGWGNTGKAYPSILKAATVPLIEAHLCKAMYKNSITPRMICAGYVEGGLNSCQGDDGGPLVCNKDGVYTLTGVTSWGNGCGHPRNPGVYTNVLELNLGLST